MRLLCKVAGRGQKHVVLCDRMASRLTENYGLARRAIHVSPNQPDAVSRREEGRKIPVDRPFRIGHLSNLSMEKGLDTVLEVFASLCDQGLKVEVHLAGPFTSRRCERLVHDYKSSFGSQVVYYGPLYGNEKEDFLSEIDLFVFPTVYSNEAYPLVVVEALNAGLPTITTRRGCLKSMVASGEFAIGEGDDFVNNATDTIRSLCARPSEYRKASVTALRRATALEQVARKQFEQLVDGLLGRENDSI